MDLNSFLWTLSPIDQEPVVVFVHTLLHQLICSSLQEKIKEIFENSPHYLFEATFNEKTLRLNETESPPGTIGRFLDAAADSLWVGLRTVPADKREGEWLVVVHGRHEIERRRVRFVEELRSFICALPKIHPMAKAFPTSGLQSEIKEVVMGCCILMIRKGKVAIF